MHLVCLRVQLFFFFNVLFVDVWKYLVEVIAPNGTFSGKSATEDEVSLNIITRVTQGMIGLLLILIGSILYRFRKERLAKYKEANKLNNALKKLRKTTWKDLIRNADPPNCVDCPICLVDWEEPDQVI
jgi:hypothetical protein